MTTQPLTPPRPSAGRVFGSIVWALTPLLSLGILTPITFVIEWIRRRTVTAFLSFAFYTCLFIWSVSANGGPQEEIALTAYIIIGWLFATAHAFVVRPKVWYLKAAAAPTATAAPTAATMPAAETLPPPVPSAQPVQFPSSMPFPGAAEQPRQRTEPVPPPPAPEPTPAPESPRQHEDTAPAEEPRVAEPRADDSQTADPRTADPILGQAQDEPVIALVAQALIDAGDAAAIPLARFEQRFFGNFRPDPAELQRFADTGRAQIQELAVTDPAAAEAAHRRAESILSELGAETATGRGSTHEPETTAAPADPAQDPEPEPEPETSEQPRKTTANTTLLDERTIGRQVCESETYRAHIQGMRRFPDSSVVTAIIDAAHTVGGFLTTAEVGRIAGRPTSSVDGYVSQLQRALNIDGVQVLSRQDNSAGIRLDLELLRQQFLGGRP